MSYTRGHELHDNLEFIMLTSLIESWVQPAMWRLFARDQIPPDFRSAQYEEARRAACLFLFHFRSAEMAARLCADLPSTPLLTVDPAAKKFAFGDSPAEDREIEKAIVEAPGVDE